MKIRVCRSDDLKEGGIKSAKVLARTVIVVRLNRELYGLEGDCKHMKASLATGKIEGEIIVCPMHGWRYNITTGDCINEPWARLKMYRAWDEEGSIFVEI